MEYESEIWDLKYKDSHYLEIRLKNYNNNYLIYYVWAKIDKGGENKGILRTEGGMWDDQWQSQMVLRGGAGSNSNSAV